MPSSMERTNAYLCKLQHYFYEINIVQEVIVATFHTILSKFLAPQWPDSSPRTMLNDALPHLFGHAAPHIERCSRSPLVGDLRVITLVVDVLENRRDHIRRELFEESISEMFSRFILN